MALQSRLNGTTTDHAISSMTFGKRQHLRDNIAFTKGDREIQTAFVEKAQALAADVLRTNPVLIENKQSRGVWVILEGWVGAAERLLMHPNNRSF
jgi:cobyric acid synthase